MIVGREGSGVARIEVVCGHWGLTRKIVRKTPYRSAERFL